MRHENKNCFLQGKRESEYLLLNSRTNQSLAGGYWKLKQFGHSLGLDTALTGFSFRTLDLKIGFSDTVWLVFQWSGLRWFFNGLDSDGLFNGLDAGGLSEAKVGFLSGLDSDGASTALDRVFQRQWILVVFQGYQVQGSGYWKN
ncbi:MAG TPA: hypothetical protein VK563_11780 [Puia sp.]|nr:hypothetical protein [Puia sp.]